MAVALVAAAQPVRAALEAGPTDFDDAYMFLRYADHLLAGAGPRWNLGEPAVNGVTSPAHLLLVTALRAALPGLADGRLLQVASALAAVLALAVTIAVSARNARHPWLHRQPAVWAALIVPAVALGDAFGFHARTGMDTMLALAASATVAGASLELARRRSVRAAWACAAVSWLALQVRPDLAPYALLTPMLALVLTPPTVRAAPLVTFMGAFAAFVCVDLTGKRLLLGTALPLAFWAKRPGHYGGFAGEWGWNPFLFLRVFLASALPFLIPLALIGRAALRPVLVLLLPVALAFAALFYPNQIMGHLGRFFFPALPVLAIAAGVALDRMVTAPPSVRALALRFGIATAVVLAGGPALEAAARRWEAPGRAQRLAALDGWMVPGSALPTIDSWRASQEISAVLAAAPPGTVAAMSEHGLVGARASAVAIVDVLGLHDPAFALHGFRTTELWRRRPDLLWMPHPDHTLMLRQILDSPELWAHHDVWPQAFHYGVAIRRDGPRAAALRALMEERWRGLYPHHPPRDHLARPAK